MNKKILACATLFCFTFSNLGGTQKNTHSLNATSVVSTMSQADKGDSIFSRAANYIKEKLSALTGLFEAPKQDLKGAEPSCTGHCDTTTSEAPEEIVSGTCWDVPCSGGSCEKTCVWSLNKTSGTIILSDPRFGMISSIEWDNPDDKNFVKIGVIDKGIGVSYINHPFRDLPNLEKIILPDLTTSGDVFTIAANCSKIEEITIPKGTKRMSLAADLCNGLKAINIGTSTFSADRAIFYRCPNVISINVDDANTAYKSVNGALLNKNGTILNSYPFGRGSRVVIPYGVKQTMSRTLAAIPSSSIVIPETVENMTEPFDADCSNLKEINFLGENAPEKVKQIYNVCDLSKDVPHFKAGTAVINVPQSYNGTEFWGYPVNKIFDDYGYLADTTTYWTTKNNGTHLSVGGECKLTSDLLSDENQGWVAHNATLEELDIEEGITAVDMNMFSGCDKLKKVTFPSTLKKLVIADGTTTVDTSSFANCSDLAEIVLPESAKSLIFAPGTTKIDFSMFSNSDSIEEVTVPSGVEWINLGALTGLDQNVTVNYLGDAAPEYFDYYPQLLTVNVRKDYFEDFLFGAPVNRVFDCGTCNDIKWVNGPHNLFEITGVGEVDSKCQLRDLKNSMKKLVIGDGITSIAPGAFYGYNFTDIKLPDTLETIGWSAFDSCRQLKNVVLPSGVKSIGKKAFQGCENLESITLNEGLEEIGENAFDGCENLHSITLPKSVKKIEAAALRNSALTEIHVADGNDFYYDVDGVLFSKPDLALVQYPAGKGGNYTVPENVKEIKSSAFCRAENLESVTIQAPLKSIGENAFYGCYNLKSVHIDGEVESIDNSAFAFCESLRVLEYNGDPKFGEDVFVGCEILNDETSAEMA